MLINSKGFQIGQLYIPPFQVVEGDFVVINIFGGAHFYDTMITISKILNGEENHKNVEVNELFSYAEYIKTNGLINKLFPKRIGQYLRESGFEKFFFEEYSYLKPQTKMNTIDNNPKKLLSVIKILSKTNRIVFDLRGNDPIGGKLIAGFIKKEIGDKGTAILIDWADDDDLKNIRTKYIEAQIVD